MLAPIYRWFASGIAIIDEEVRPVLERVVSALCTEEPVRGEIRAFLASADLGITDVEVIEEDLSSYAVLHNLSPDSPFRAFSPRIGAGVQLRHRADPDGGEVVLPFDQESQGTRTFFELSAFIITVLKVGGVLLVDELDRSLHPHLALRIVEMFSDPATNPNNAQLIFNTHDTNLLDTRILRRDQIWFTEKGDDGATRLFPLTDFRARKYENLERGYLQGRYGAVPSVRMPDFLRRVGG
jgi:hypothetical protein